MKYVRAEKDIYPITVDKSYSVHLNCVNLLLKCRIFNQDGIFIVPILPWHHFSTPLVTPNRCLLNNHRSL